MIKFRVEIGAHQGNIQAVSPSGARASQGEGFEAGKTYRAVVTGKVGELTELLIGNRYLLARSAFNLRPGQAISLFLAEARADLLVFRLAGATVPAGVRIGADVEAALLKLGIASSAESALAARNLTQAGIALNAINVPLFMRLSGEFGEARMPVVAMIYAKLIAAGANPPYSTLAAIASYISTPPSLGKALDDLRKMRERRGETRLNDALGALVLGRDGASAEDIRAILAFLFSPPERDYINAVLDFEETDDAEAGNDSELEIGGFSALAAMLEDDAPQMAEDGERTALEKISAHVAALNVLNALPDEGVVAEIPIEIGGQAASAVLEYRGGPGAAYDEDFAAFLTIETEELGKIEAHIVRRAGAIRASVMAENDDTLAALERSACGAEFAANIAQSCGVRDAEAVIERLRTKPALITDGSKTDGGK